MSKLNVKVVPNPLVTESGQYTIKGVKTAPTKFGSMMAIRVLNKDQEEKSILVPVFPKVTSMTNLGKLVNTFGDETDKWVGKRINIKIENNRSVIDPIR
jgi:hypothetical protein